MTRAMGRTMLRVDGEEHARLRAPAQSPLRFRGFADRWGDMFEPRGRRAAAPAARPRAHGRARATSPARSPPARSSCCSALTRRARRRPGVRVAGVHRRDRQLRRRPRHVGALRARQPARRRGDRPPTWSPRRASTVLRALIDAGTLSDDEIRANIKLFISGGLNEPRDVIATALHALLADPEQEALAREGIRRTSTKATEESLRWTSPIGMFPRVVQQDTELGGVELAGQHADRRAHRVGEPRRAPLGGPRPLRPAPRHPPSHLAFSRGPHVCPGAYVARQQVARAALPALLALPRYPAHRWRGPLPRVGVPRAGAPGRRLGRLTRAPGEVQALGRRRNTPCSRSSGPSTGCRSRTRPGSRRS